MTGSLSSVAHPDPLVRCAFIVDLRVACPNWASRGIYCLTHATKFARFKTSMEPHLEKVRDGTHRPAV